MMLLLSGLRLITKRIKASYHPLSTLKNINYSKFMPFRLNLTLSSISDDTGSKGSRG
jgi:hypothetical protein